ncbi:hypothetical protein PRIPAC_81162 [Pristionchus pacificus]|uniref:Uncharacterized protein n=1 Tax=Pristionchus pacificus TaxID=54126 RepID=A0A2A6CND0_PRIPA|nr:hypothetical protein PRIPAC_81162 [Pristionchus pacificus]|eukprot:PDM79563.1 hypothetical protein PRIPAC_32142 [Pristionchus pacificus]
MNCVLISALLLLCASLTIRASPPYFTYRTRRYRMLDGSFRRPYRLPSSSVLLGNNWLQLEAPTSSTVREERKRLPYYHGFGKGR